ncbi:MAG: YbaY family lipoprotein [Thermomicrobiales bacterium]|nr:YbaY family lipoprotein [Thermomicrobiales bacterium]
MTSSQGRMGLTMHRRGVLVAGALALISGNGAAAAAFTPAPDGAEVHHAGGPVAITGSVIFPADLPAGPSAPIALSVQDVSRADAPAVELASVIIPAGATPPAPGEAVPFSIPVAAYDARLTYAVRAHVDRDGDGRVSSGDLVSTTHIPVLTRGAGTVVDVPLSVVS